jgi:hypothetical protein
VRYATQEQSYFGAMTVRLKWRVLALSLHRLPPEFGITSLTQLKRLIKLDYSPSAVVVKNATDELQRDKLLVEAGVMSKRTLAERHNLDYAAEQALIALESGTPGTALPSTPAPVPSDNPVDQTGMPGTPRPNTTPVS